MHDRLAPLAAIFLAAHALAQPITLDVDATDAPRRIFHSAITIPAKPGPLTLAYPNWIPGEHAPIGPISDVAGLRITAAGKPIPWRRDLADAWLIHCDVPPGNDAIDVRFDYLSSLEGSQAYTDGPASTPQLAIIDWHLLVVYPFDAAHPINTDTLTYRASIKPPKGWACLGSLELAPGVAGTPPPDGATLFAPTSLTMLIDHPVLIGAHHRQFDLSPGQSPPHILDVVADSEAALAAPPDRIRNYRSLVAEAAALFGARRYQKYHFLLSLSDHTNHFGLEHHECSDDRQAERFLVDDDEHRADGSLLSHEYFHSWNGKFRRPGGMATPDYQRPMNDELIWVYEGLTEYYGDVLAARCGNWSPDEYREYVAKVTAALDHTSGRNWRCLQDTCDGAPFLYLANGTWGNWRRGTDFYDEGELIWLEADTIIRRDSGGAKSLDDFCRAFHGAGFKNGSLSGETPRVERYTFDDVIRTLNQVQPHDWAAFFRSRLDRIGGEAPKGGLNAAGWELVYTDAPNIFAKSAGDFISSAGFSVKDSGEVDNVAVGSAADKAGLGPGMRLVAVNGRRYSPDLLRSALFPAPSEIRILPADAKPSVGVTPIDLLVENGEFYSTLKLAAPDAPQNPHLRRIENTPDLFAEILKPVAAEEREGAQAPVR